MLLNNNLTLTVSLRTREKILFEGQVNTVTSFNHRGRFDILPEHTNFITLISRYVILNTDAEGEQKFELDKGVLYVMTNRVNVYVGI